MNSPINLTPDSARELYLESRFKESMFRRFEPLITIAVAAFPEETKFTVPDSMAPTTFVARFRDAFLSLKRFRWDEKGTTIDMKKLVDMNGKYLLSLDRDDQNKWIVWFRQKALRGQARKMANFDSQATFTQTAQPNPPWTAPISDDELVALCRLLSSRRITGPFFILSPVNEALTSLLQEQYDVALRWDEEKKLTVVT